MYLNHQIVPQGYFVVYHVWHVQICGNLSQVLVAMLSII